MNDRVESFIARTLAQQPARRAPRTLEERVLTAIESRSRSRAARAGFGSWPYAVRALFLIACAGLARVSLAVIPWLVDALRTKADAAVTEPLSGWTRAFSSLWDVMSSVSQDLASPWISTLLALAALLYAALFGLGALAYRTLGRQS